VPKPTRPGDTAQVPRPPLIPRPAQPKSRLLARLAKAPDRRPLPLRLITSQEAGQLGAVKGLFEPLLGLLGRNGPAVLAVGRDNGVLGRRPVLGEPQEKPLPRRGAAGFHLACEEVRLHSSCYYI
jgi:hypothetical protein